MISTALITAPPRGCDPIFGRPLLERLMLICERAGAKRFFIEVKAEQRSEVVEALGRFRGDPSVTLVDSFRTVFDQGVARSAPCMLFSGNLVMTSWQLGRILARQSKEPNGVVKMISDDYDHSGAVVVGPCESVLSGLVHADVTPTATVGQLPFALNGRPEDAREAELRLAQSLRFETKGKDALMARVFDRKLSWRMSLMLARYTSVSPNQVTIANTLLGLISAVMFGVPSYWWRVAASLLFVVSITIDGVDGELARLKMKESDFGAKLDIITDNIVHVAVFAGIFIGVYRETGHLSYLYLLASMWGGFLWCAYEINRALKLPGDFFERWIEKVERLSGRDFAYLLLAFAASNLLYLFCWGTGFGTYVVAAATRWITNRELEKHLPAQ